MIFGFWFSGSWTKEFEGPGSHLKELRRFWTSIWRTWKNFEGPERRRYVPDPFEGKGSRKLVPDFHIKGKGSRKTSNFFFWILREETLTNVSYLFFFGTPKIPKTKMVFSSSGFQHDFWLSGRLLDRISKSSRQNFEGFQLSCFCLDGISKVQNTESTLDIISKAHGFSDANFKGKL
uniref:Uncharacterized protein n=1 Tax=Rhizophagus irregularis (strain DAOM 181602 / DAOM 197198 / MUCL 43194) TaxID=747089 RepID=U9UI44_RHIID